MNDENQVPSIPGYQTYIVEMGNEISIHLKPAHENGPLMTLDPEGKWYSKPRNAYYKLDSHGARWVAIIRPNKKVENPKFVPDNVLAVLTVMSERNELSNRQIKEARKRAKKGNFIYLRTLIDDKESKDSKIKTAIASLPRKN